ncbi:hypothetical protein [Spirosoma rhododendri]|uniref:META domain-containing protein n=1 Tax=Spirosoma rhododendri TaxID=2728024 RepID=A0A7L5DNC6_9BACT|nr:hypothetical protein [Spirosoma rhododendri]QJD77968.1 hypothetical protein HH216_05685 [Spirosoma rhododendri]
MKSLLFALSCVLLVSQCKPSAPKLDPKIARLVGTWVLEKPDSAAGSTVTFALDMANPPHDITSFDLQGQSVQTSYVGRMYATIDGTMQFQQISQTAKSGSDQTDPSVSQSYLVKLGSVARYEQLTDSTLRLYFGRPRSGVLSYKIRR